MSTPNASITNTGPWRYNTMLRIVSHKTHACNTCTAWVLHYASSALDGERSLTDAETQRESVIRGGLVAENAKLQQNNDLLQQTIASLHRSLDAMCADFARVSEDLDNTRRRLTSADDEIIRMRNENEDLERGADKTINDLHDQVEPLKIELRDLEPGHTPRRRKVPRRGSRTPYTPRTTL